MTFTARLTAAVRRTGTPLCVGIDPWPERLPGRAALGEHPSHAALALCAEDFGMAVIEAVAGRVPAVKPQFAFFEGMGPAGMVALERVCAYARERELIVVGDAKRGDIGSTAMAYALATLDRDAAFPCDALTVSPFLGPDTIEPFLTIADANDRGVFVLLRTSNPGSARWQLPILDDLVAWIDEQGAARAAGLANVGVVVGATKGPELEGLRARLPHAWMLVPGFGAQGATAADARKALLPDGTGALIPSSRSATFPDRPDASYDQDPVSWIASRVDQVMEQLAC